MAMSRTWPLPVCCVVFVYVACEAPIHPAEAMKQINRETRPFDSHDSPKSYDHQIGLDPIGQHSGERYFYGQIDNGPSSYDQGAPEPYGPSHDGQMNYGPLYQKPKDITSVNEQVTDPHQDSTSPVYSEQRGVVSPDDPVSAAPPPPHPYDPAQSRPRNLRVLPAPMPASDHELQFNISWSPPLGGFPTDYSLEILGMTATVDCESSMCYEYNIPGEAMWWMMPAEASAVEGAGCALRPGCAYRVRLTAHPWDGRTAAILDVELDECVAGVCSCGHAARLPRPLVHAVRLDSPDPLQPPAVNITWTLPPGQKRRLPPHLRNDYYFVSVGRQLVSPAPRVAPWFAHEVTGRTGAGGTTLDGDSPRWLVLTFPPQTAERIIESNSWKKSAPGRMAKSERLLARVALVDGRGCMGPVGNYTLYDTAEESNLKVGPYMVWLMVALVGAMGAGVAALIGARRVKRALAACRAPAPAPSPLRSHPAWLPLQSRKS